MKLAGVDRGEIGRERLADEVGVADVVSGGIDGDGVAEIIAIAAEVGGKEQGGGIGVEGDEEDVAGVQKFFGVVGAGQELGSKGDIAWGGSCEIRLAI